MILNSFVACGSIVPEKSEAEEKRYVNSKNLFGAASSALPRLSAHLSMVAAPIVDPSYVDSSR